MTSLVLSILAFLSGVPVGLLVRQRKLREERDGYREAAIDANLQLAFERDRRERMGSERKLSNLRTAMLAGGKRGPHWSYGQDAGRN